MPRGVEVSKSIFKKLERIPDPKAAPIIQQAENYSKPVSKSTCMLLKNVGSKRATSVCDSIKLSAIYNGCYSLAANQVNMHHNIFTVHKNLKNGLWFYPMKEEDIPEEYRENFPSLEEEMTLDNFRIFANPRLIAITNFKEYDWERCGSFPGMKAQVLRPIGIKLAYQTETGELKEDNFFDFEARVICHEIDHLIGKDISDYNISEGSISVDQNVEIDNKKLEEEMKNYKDKIAGLDKEFVGNNNQNQDFPEFQNNSIELEDITSNKVHSKSEYGKGAKFNTNYMMKMFDAANKELKNKKANESQNRVQDNSQVLNDKLNQDLRRKK